MATRPLGARAAANSVRAGAGRLASGLVGAGLVLVATAAAGQQGADATAMSLDQLLTTRVFTASRFPQKVSDAPSAVSIVTADDIRTYGYRSLADILRAMRGLHVTYDRNYSYLGVRGFAPPGDYNARILILVDGFRLNNGTYDETPIGHDFPLDVESIERVEFVSGPGSAVYGGNAFFGVLNVITRKGEGGAGTQVIGQAGSNAWGRGYVARGASGRNDTSWRLAASYSDAPGSDLAFPEFADAQAGQDGIARHLDGERYWNVFGQGSLGPFSVVALANRRTKGIPTASYGQVFGDDASRTVDERWFVGISWAGPVTPALQFAAQASVGASDYDGVYIYDAPTPRNVNFDGASSRWWSVEAKGVYAGWRDHTLVFGIDLRGDARIRQWSYDDTGTLVDDSRRRTSAGLYVQDEWTLAPEWLLNLGARVDLASGETAAANPRLGLIYKPEPRTAVKLLYGTAYRNPNAYETSYYAGNASSSPPSAERIRSAELITEHYVDNSWKVTAAGFAYRLHNLIILDVNPEDGTLYYRNGGTTWGRGIELESAQVFDHGVQLRANYTYQSVADSPTGPQANSPRQLVKLNLSSPLPGDIGRVGVEVQGTSARHRLSGERVGGFTLVNLVLSSVRIAPRLQLAAGVRNLLDHRQRDPEGAEHSDSRGRRLAGIEQDGRRWWVGIEYAY